jgi:hypothetical protein
MPKITLAGYENRIREYSADKQLPLGRTDVRKLAKGISRWFEACNETTLTDSHIDMYMRLTYSDPTGEKASRRADAETRQANAARRIAARAA